MASRNISVLKYSIRDIGLQIKCSPGGIAKHVNDLIARYNFISAAPHIKPVITLSVHLVSDLSLRLLQKARLILRFHVYGFEIYKKGNHLFLTDNSNLLIIQSVQGKGILIIRRQNKSNLVSVLNRFFLPALIELLRSRNLFYLHAAGASKNGHKILFVSEGGKGKSTNVLSLLLDGWQYLSDDSVFLKYNNKKQVKAISLTSELRLKIHNPILKKMELGFLQKLSKKNYGLESFYQVNIASVMPNRVVKSFVPNLILFCSLSRYNFSVLKPINRPEAVLYLIDQSKSIFLGGKLAKNNGAILFDLINQAKSYILEIGKDIQRDKLYLSDLISKSVI